MFLKSFQMYVENSNVSDVDSWKLIYHEKMKAAEEKCPKGLNIFIVYFELQ